MNSATQNGDSDSESGRPESLSLSASASKAKERDRALKIHYASQKRKTRETNKRRDDFLKAQAGRRGSIASSERGERNPEHHGVEADDIEGGSDMDVRLHRRMTRAMGDAEEEVELVSGSESGGEWGGIKSADPENFRNRRMDEDTAISKGDTRALDSDRVSDEGGVGSDDSSAIQSTTAKYLPDHLFTAALTKSRPSDCVRPSQTTPKARSNNKKRRHPHARAKDVVVG